MLRYLALFLGLAPPAYGLPVTYTFVASVRQDTPAVKPGAYTGTLTYDLDTQSFSLVFAVPDPLPLNLAGTPTSPSARYNDKVFDLSSSGALQARPYVNESGSGVTLLVSMRPRPVQDLWPANLDAFPVHDYDVGVRLNLFGENDDLRPSDGWLSVWWDAANSGYVYVHQGGSCADGTPIEECPLSTFHFWDQNEVRYDFTEFHAVPEPRPALLVFLAGVLVSLRSWRWRVKRSSVSSLCSVP
jgi:hypothetical protein